MKRKKEPSESANTKQRLHSRTMAEKPSGRSIFLLLAVLILFSSMSTSFCAKKPVGLARKEDIPFIKCQVCHKLAAQLHQQVQIKQHDVAPRKVSEFQIIEIAENVCNLKKQESDWILKIDIVENGDKLELVEQESEGQCNSECKTIERACQEVLGYSDTDVAEYIYKNKPKLDSLINFTCKDLTKACSSKPPPVPKDRVPGETFIPKSSKEAEMDRLLKSMEGMPGAPGMKMYSREDLINQNFGDEDAEDEDDDEDIFPSKSGKAAIREKEKYDWKEKIKTGVVEATERLKYHAVKASEKIKKWWRRSGKKAEAKKGSKAEL